MNVNENFIPRLILSICTMSSEQQCNCAIGNELLRLNVSADEKMSNQNEKKSKNKFLQSSRSIKSLMNECN